MRLTCKQKEQLRQFAYELGFQFCGFSKAEFLETEAKRVEAWLSAGLHGKMSYLEKNFEKRLDPRLLVEGCKTVISLAINYFPKPEHKQPEDAPLISC
ncbi:MAG: DUF1730 domain-containing protein, partial [Bacteroidia bacterium]|nr:DUF1730 domain-containing protein [Bacteroidia bacterium]